MFGDRTRRREPGKKCPRCRRETVVYVGTDVLHGNPFTPAADTDVEHRFECAYRRCKNRWSEWA